MMIESVADCVFLLCPDDLPEIDKVDKQIHTRNKSGSRGPGCYSSNEAWISGKQRKSGWDSSSDPLL